MSGIDDALREELNALLDGELPPARAEELRRRMETDPALAREFAELKLAAAALRGLPAAPAPAELRERVMASLPRGRLRYAFVVAAVIAASVVAAIFLQPRQEAPTESLAARREEPPPEEKLRRAGEESAVERGAEAPVPATAAGEKAEALEATADAKRKESAGPLDRVPAAEPERTLYFRALAALKTEDLRRTLLAASAGGRAAGTETPMEGAVTSPQEARSVQELLERAFPKPPGGDGMAPSARIVGGAGPRIVEFEIQATPEEAAAVGRWLASLRPPDAPPRESPSAPKAEVEVRGDRKKALQEDAAARAVKVRITYPAPR